MTRRPVLEFWYEFASTYSYLAAMRIEDLAETAGVDVRWRPFLLGPIFASQGWTSSPFNLFPAKGRHMWRDMERQAASLGLPFQKPDPFPQNTLAAARIALYGCEEGWGPDFSRAVFRAEFGEGRAISETGVLRTIMAGIGIDPERASKGAAGEANRTRLKAVNEEARSRGLFGAPTFFAEDGEMFWGNDRLEQALDWAAGRRRPAATTADPQSSGVPATQ